MNCDNVVDIQDVPLFVNALVSGGVEGGIGCNIDRADINQDGTIDGRDIAGFVQCVLNAGCQ